MPLLFIIARALICPLLFSLLIQVLGPISSPHCVYFGANSSVLVWSWSLHLHKIQHCMLHFLYQLNVWQN